MYVIALLLAFTSMAWADEVFEPTTPQVPVDTITTYRVDRLNIETTDRGVVIDILVSPRTTGGACAKDINGVCVPQVNAVYTGETARTMLNGLNTANLSTTSLRKRILQRLQTDGYLPAGSITGTPGIPTTTTTTIP